MIDLSFATAALLSGFFGSAHCIAMCGGIATVLQNGLSTRGKPEHPLLPALFHLGRISGYCFIVAVLAFFTQAGIAYLQWQWLSFSVRLLSAFMLIAMGLYISQWWPFLQHLEKLGAAIWRYIKPRFLQRGAQSGHQFYSAYVSGLLWGFLPCGLVYSALTSAILQTTFLASVLFMLLFGAGTIPALMASAGGLKWLSRSQLNVVRKIGGLFLIALGLWIFVSLMQRSSSADADHSAHQHHHTMNHD